MGAQRVRDLVLFMKKLAQAVGLCAALALGSSMASAADQELLVWCWDDNFNVPAAKLAGEKFMAAHPDVKVTVQSIAQDNIVQKLNAALGANNVRGLPDVVLIEDYRVKNFMVGYPDFLRDITDSIDVSNFIDSKVYASSYNGRHYGVPFDSGTSALFLRKDIIEKAGLSVTDFQDITFNQYLDLGKTVKEKTGVALLPFDPNDLIEMRLMLQSNGEWFTAADDVNKVTVKDNVALKQAFNFYQRVTSEGLGYTITGWNQLLSSFQQGKVASLVYACWIMPSIKQATDQSGNWVVIPMPKVEGPNATHFSNSGGSQWYVNNYSNQADLATQFLKETFASDHDLINELVDRIGLISTMKDANNLPNYQEGDPFFGGQKVGKDFVEWNTQIPSVNYGIHTKEVESVVGEAMQSVLQGTPVDEALEQAQEMAQMQLGM